MAYQFSRFEQFLLAGLVVTGIGLATHYLSENVDERGGGPGAKAPAEESENRTWFQMQMPPQDWFVDDYFVGVEEDGERVEGAVVGYPYGGREIKIRDRQGGKERVLALEHFREWKIGRRPFDRDSNTLCEIHLVRPGGSEVVLYGYRIADNEKAYLFKLESGEEWLPRDAIKKIVPAKR